ncbi:MAG: hypothetical protein ACYTHJ_06695 [Planctomycetota bacterium]|jgi:hypothetical protein
MKSSLNLAVAVTAFTALSAQIAVASGGETCATATPVITLPYSDNGTTCGADNDYDEACNAASGSPDVVYELNPVSNQCINVGLCNGTNFNAKLYIYSSANGICPASGTGDTNLDVACAEDGCPDGPQVPRMANLLLQGGVTYWVVVDGAGDACGNYQIVFTSCGVGVCTTDLDCCDGDYCNGREVCGVDGTCQPGELDCDDDNPCTEDTCNPDLEICIHTPIPECCVAHGQCDDGNECTDDFCDRPDSCNTGTCTYAPRAAGAPCGNQQGSQCDLSDTCDGNGICEPNLRPDGSPCFDGLYCTQNDTCSNGVCTGGTQRDCDDGSACTIDICDNDEAMCEYVPVEDCCITNDDCDDGNDCTVNVCADGNCVNPPLPTGTSCGNDADTACSNADTCVLGECMPNHLEDGTTCDDGDSCTMTDRCVSGLCLGLPDPVCATESESGGLNPALRRLNFQAFLVNDIGDPLDGPADLVFQLYGDQDNPLGSPIMLDAVMVEQGIINTQIPLPFGAVNGLAREIGVSVNGDEEMFPRIPLAASPFALEVDTVGSSELARHLNVGGGSSGGLIQVFGPQGTVAGGPGFASVSLNTQNSVDPNGMLHVCGTMTLADDTADTTVMLNACEPDGNSPFYGGGGGQLRLADGSGTVTVEIDSSNTTDGAAELAMYHDGGDIKTVKLQASETGIDGAQLALRNSSDKATAILDAESSTGAHLYLRGEDGNDRMVEIVSTETGTDGAEITLNQADGSKGVEIDAESGSGAKIRLFQNDYNADSSTFSDDVGVLLDGNHTDDGGSTGYGRIRVRSESGESTVTIDGDYNDTGKGRVRTDILKIDGGSDLSETFDVNGADVQPGYLVSIDPNDPGKLEVSTSAYDHTLAGVISGAGGIDPGLIMGQAGSIADGEYPVAMSGRVYCWADAGGAAIRPGDLLTTSNVIGHAMRADDRDRMSGAVIGKAMTSLTEGRGLVLVLIRPQ